ncbi:MAG TPA: EamA family transporter [Polyangia bacterium]
MTALAYVACALIWGTTWFAIRVCLYHPARGGYPPLTGAALRFLVAAAILWAAFALSGRRRRPHGARAHLALLGAGVLNALGYAAVYLGETRVSGGTASVLYALLPFLVTLFAALSGTERPSRALLGAVLGFAGVAVIGSESFAVGGAARLTGVVWILASVTTASLYTVVLKRFVVGVSPLAMNAHFALYGCLTLSVLALCTERGAPTQVTLRPTLALLYLALFGTAVTFVAYFYLLQHARLVVVSSLVLVEPVLALCIDVVAGDGQLGPRGYAGAALVLAGTVVVALLGRGPAVGPAPPPA